MTYQIFFVVGLPKTGTTWMMNMLGHFDGVLCLGEGRFFSSGVDGVPSLDASIRESTAPWYEYVAHRKRNWIGLDDAIETVERRNVVPGDVLEQERERDADALVGAAVRHFLDKGARRHPDARWVGDKTPVRTPGELRSLLRVFPDARVLFLQRDPNDFVVSLLHHYWRSTRAGRDDAGMPWLGPEDFERVDRFVAGKDENLVSVETARTLASCWVAVDREARASASTQPEQLRITRYEDLFAEPARELSAAATHLGVEASEERVGDIVERTSAAATAAGDDESLKRHIRSGQPGDWRDQLSATAAAAIDAIVGA